LGEWLQLSFSSTYLINSISWDNSAIGYTSWLVKNITVAYSSDGGTTWFTAYSATAPQTFAVTLPFSPVAANAMRFIWRSTYGDAGISFASIAALTYNGVLWVNNSNLRGPTGPTGYVSNTQLLTTITGASGVVTHNWALGTTFYHSSMASNFTCNFTNLPTTSPSLNVAKLVLIQGSIGYFANALQVAGSSVPISWQNGTSPTGTANKTDIEKLSLVYNGSSWQALGEYKTFG